MENFLTLIKVSARKKFDDLKEKLSADQNAFENYIDLTLPGRRRKIGSRHILIQTLNEIKAIFKDLGFSVYDGPELESDYYNFEMLNFPPDHPARDMQDTYFITEDFSDAHSHFTCSGKADEGKTAAAQSYYARQSLQE